MALPLVLVIALPFLYFMLIFGPSKIVQLQTAEYLESQESALYLTPLIEENKTLEARQLSRVYPDIANTTSFNGYFTVDQKCESNLFFWFCQAQSNWEKSPTLLWLQGGPGSSSLFGMFVEIGPFSYEGEMFKKRQISWNRKVNLLFIDQPVGSGYSFSGKSCYAKSKDDIVRDLYSAIKQFCQLFPSLKNNPFYLAGESYAGHYIPYIAHYIHKQNHSEEETIKLSGLMIGNGWMDSYYQTDYGDLLYSIGLIDADQKKSLEINILTFRNYINLRDLKNASNELIRIENKIDNYMAYKINPYNYLQSFKELKQYEELFDFSFLREKIPVGTNQFSTKENIMNTVYRYLEYDTIKSVKSEVEELLEHYPVVFYFGQLDIICPYLGALNFLRELRWSGASGYQNASRRQWCVDGQLAGFYKSSHNLHEVLVRNAGHSVPMDQPLWAFILADSVTSSPQNDPLGQLNSC